MIFPTKRRRGAVATQSQAQFRVKLLIEQEIASQRTLAMTETKGHYFVKTQ